MILYNVYPNRRAAEADLPMVRALHDDGAIVLRISKTWCILLPPG